MKIDPCPFCKKSVELTTLVPNGWFSRLVYPDRVYYIQCKNEICRIKPSTEEYLSPTSAIESWNYSNTKDYPY